MPRTAKSTRNTIVGTTPTAINPYCPYTCRSARRSSGRSATAAAVAGLAFAGQARQVASVKANERAARPIQAPATPVRKRAGTSVPDAAMPTPSPRKMAPAAIPRRPPGTCGSTTLPTSTMMAPPVTPDSKRQKKNQPGETGTAQARNASAVSAIDSFSAATEPMVDASRRPPMAPTK
jgi:hypothetical protein